MPTVPISSADYAVYADLATADDYLLADFSATTWRDETVEDQKSRALVTSTRILNRMPWSSDRDWPRAGTADTDTGDVPQDVIDASIVLAKLIHAGSTVDSSPTTASTVRRQKAGSVEIEYFDPTLFSDPTRLPIEVWELIQKYLSSITVTALASGTDGESITCNPYTVGYESP